MMKRKLISSVVALSCLTPCFAYAQSTTIEEVIVTAQKREEPLQEAPLAISALGAEQLETRGISGLGDLTANAIPSLKAQPFPNNPSTMIISMRGIGQADAGQVTKEMAVGIYFDGVYLGRAQGLGFDMVDLERIEVLRGPQGTLYGRNSIGGAINLVSRKPNEELSFRQTFSVGNYDYRRSLTQFNLPVTDNFFVKAAYMKDQRDGWVKNRASGEHDYNEHDKEGARIALRFEPTESIVIDYAYDHAEVETSQNYFQFARIEQVPFLGVPFITGQPLEPDRETRTRRPMPLEPSDTTIEGHTFSVSWNPVGDHTFKYLASWRELDEFTSGNYGGVFLIGLVPNNDVKQEQTSHELQAVGTLFNGRVDYVAGVYYYEEEAEERSDNLWALIPFPTGVGGAPPFLQFTPAELGLNIPAAFQPESIGAGTADDRFVESESESQAVYTQIGWHPPVLEDRLGITLGMRWTKDDKKAVRTRFGGVSTFQESKNDDTNFSPTLTLDYEWNPDIKTYVKWANGYRAGGTNQRSATFRSYDLEEVETWELGIKSMFLDNRLRVNAALFTTDWKDAQIDFSDPVDITISETINATSGDVEIDGFEIEITAVPFSGLELSLDYQWLDWNYPDQLNPLSGQVERFVLPQAPEHSAALDATYTLPPMSFGTLSFNANVTASSGYYYTPQNYDKGDGYGLVNARVMLSDIPVGPDRGKLELSAWGKNLGDKEWVTYSIQSLFTLSEAYGTPRTFGLDLTYRY